MKMDISVKYRLNGEKKEFAGLENDDFRLQAIQQGERLTVTIHPRKTLMLHSVTITEPYEYKSGCQIFLNGYQSWTETREFDLSEAVHNMNRLPSALKERFHFEAYGDPWFYKYERQAFHGYTYSYIKKPDGTASLIGSLNEENAFLIIHYGKRDNIVQLRSDCENKVLHEGEEFPVIDVVHYEGTVREVLERYFSYYGTCTAPEIRGYTSWYLHYQDINEDKIRTALSGIDSDQFDLFQIDDGYEAFVGDWMEIDPVKFPNGLAPVVEEIHAKGLKAGIWLAPFVCETESRLYREHPDWILKKDGKEVFAGSNWSGDVALDIRRRDVQEYIRRCLEYYIELGFDFFKLDFLYAAALVSGKEVPGADLGALSGSEGIQQPPAVAHTRAEIMRSAMKGLREVLKDKLILGCGVPLSSAFNLVDYCRIGPDVSLKFDDVFYMRPMHRERISTKTTLLNTIFRSVMDGHVFRNDPDVFLLRDDNISLSKDQRRALITINHLCGAVYMTSDNVGEYDDEKRQILDEARVLSKAQITDVRKEGNAVAVDYELDGAGNSLRYDIKRGVLI